MNEFVDILAVYGFERQGTRLREPIVVHCVPGAGKTHLIRRLLESSDLFEAFTTAAPDLPNLSGRYIKDISNFKTSGKLLLIDEYQNLPVIPEGVFAVFGDPLQALKPNLLPADFICYTSRRFGKHTTELLRSLDFKVQSELDDEVIIEEIFSGEPEGQVICFEAEVVNLLRAHNLNFLTPCSCQGQTFDIVTFITSGIIQQDNRHLHLICTSRHKSKLKILCPRAEYPSLQ